MKKGCGLFILFSFIIAILNLLPFGCNSVEVTKDPVQELIEQESTEPMFTILLFDMNQEGVFSKVYKHRYRIIKKKAGRVVGLDTKWYNVSSSYFQQNENNLGMEMVSKNVHGAVLRTVGPPGYTNFIGKAEYGYWLAKDSVVQYNLDSLMIDSPDLEAAFGESGTSEYLDYWRFYSKYEYIRTLLQIPQGKIRQKDYKEARRNYNSGFIYYGIITTGGRRRYGTYSNHYRTNTYNKTWSRGGGGSGK